MPNKSNSPVTTERFWRTFFIHVSLIVGLFLLGIFIGFGIRTHQIVRHQMLSTARAHFNNIVLTRRWSADSGGVYVTNTAGVVSNPYLENPDIVTMDGEVYTKKNPALMTREISLYAEKSGNFKYHITSLRPLNPDNKADAFESDALRRFERGEPEIVSDMTQDGQTFFRYMAPLFVEKGCLGCHAKQGYDIGEVRGGISVIFDVTETKQQMNLSNMIFGALGVLLSGTLLVVLFLLSSRLSGKLSGAYETIEQMSVTDELTQLFNRRYFHKRLDEEIAKNRRFKHPLGLLLLDIDHFKKVNDVYGHLTGDEVLKGISALLKANTRSLDVVARYGGEEIVLILAETDEEGAMAAAEKIRLAVETFECKTSEEKNIRVTVSVGVSTLKMVEGREGDPATQLIKLADDALYVAKESGRNRVYRISEEGTAYESSPI